MEGQDRAVDTFKTLNPYQINHIFASLSLFWALDGISTHLNNDKKNLYGLYDV